MLAVADMSARRRHSVINVPTTCTPPDLAYAGGDIRVNIKQARADVFGMRRWIIMEKFSW